MSSQGTVIFKENYVASQDLFELNVFLRGRGRNTGLCNLLSPCVK